MVGTWERPRDGLRLLMLTIGHRARRNSKTVTRRDGQDDFFFLCTGRRSRNDTVSDERPQSIRLLVFIVFNWHPQTDIFTLYNNGLMVEYRIDKVLIRFH